MPEVSSTPRTSAGATAELATSVQVPPAGQRGRAGGHAPKIRLMKLAIAVCALALTASGTVASAGTTLAGPMPTLRADVGEWSIVPSAGSVRAGRVRIEIRNLGTFAHQVTLVRTRSFDARLPLSGNRALVQPIAQTALVRAGARASLVVTLRAGSYLLLDNLPWHYWKGTSVAFSVR
jgi:uncharacterized cupredoxin-like copper-binding protein